MMPSDSPSPYAELGRRIAALPWLKTFGMTAFMYLFFRVYFLILENPCFDVIVMPLTLLDRAIPYQPWTWALYVSLWIYVGFPAAFSRTRRELFIYGWTAAAVSAVGFLFFVFLPTAVPAVQIAGGSTFERIRSIDTTGNSCPSLHVAFSVLTALWHERLFRGMRGTTMLRWVNVLWCAAIVYSTLSTKQHVFWDAVAGSMLGIAGAALNFRIARDITWTAPAPVADVLLESQIKPAARKL